MSTGAHLTEKRSRRATSPAKNDAVRAVLSGLLICEKLFELGYRVWLKLDRALDPNSTGTWAALSASQQEEMDGAIVMFQEAMDQVGRGSG